MLCQSCDLYRVPCHMQGPAARHVGPVGHALQALCLCSFTDLHHARALLALQADLLASALEGPDALLDYLANGKRATKDSQVSFASISNLEQLQTTSEVSLIRAPDSLNDNSTTSHVL